MISTDNSSNRRSTCPSRIDFFWPHACLESLPPDLDEASLDDPELIAELDRRFGDLAGLIPAEELWPAT
jgi:hypothetical protein